MRYVTFIAVAVLTFGTGVLVSSVSLISESEVSEIKPVAESMEDDWHRIFEAATMLKDQEERGRVLGRLQCLGRDHSLRRQLAFIGEGTYCVEFNGEMVKSPLVFYADDPYPRLIKTHNEWSRKNMTFIRMVSDPSAADSFLKRRLRDQ